jgi:hypothetical protein
MICACVSATVSSPVADAPGGGKAEAWILTPYLHAGEPSKSAFIKVALDSGIPIKEIASSSHQLDVKRDTPERAVIDLAKSASGDNNRDFILDYRLAGERIDSGLMLYQGPDENFFLAMLEPPKAVAPQQITPREYIFIVVVTDGYVSVEKEAFDLIRNNLGSANLFAFGIGSSVNRHLIEGMARAGRGEPFVVTDEKAAKEEAARFRAYIDAPVLTNIKLSFAGFDAYDVEPVSVPDVFAARPVIVFGKWRGEKTGTISIEGATGEGRFLRLFSVANEPAREDSAALRYLWARSRIATLADYNQIEPNDARVAEVTQLGLKYHLLTQYTSFVAVDKIVRNAGGQQDGIDQPSPMPEGVSDLAVGGDVPSTPEPETYLLVAAMLALLLWMQYTGRLARVING